MTESAADLPAGGIDERSHAIPNDLHFVIAVGINIYPGAGIPLLNHARGDALAFVNWARREGGVPERNIALLSATKDDAQRWTSEWESHPVKQHFDRALDCFNTRAKTQVEHVPADWNRTRLYVFVAGHGFNVAGGSTALIMADATFDRLGYSVALERYLTWLFRCEYYQEIIFFADCCRTNVDKPPDPHGPPFNPCGKPKKMDGKRMLGYATRDGAEAGATFDPDPDAGRGHFTRLLLRGLQGEAPDTHGAVTAVSLGEYLDEKLPARTSNSQRAEISTTGSIVFRPPVAVPEYAVTVRFSDGYRGRATLHQGDGFAEIDEWSAAKGNWELRLRNGLYELRLEHEIPVERGVIRVSGEPLDVEV